MKVNAICLLAAIGLFSGNAAAETEWIHRTLMGNTLPPPKCTAKPEAMEKTAGPDNIKEFAKRFCGTQGYGWSLENVKNDGKLVCEACSGDKEAEKYNCHMEDVVAECKRIKPGSVGMLPGKG